MMSGIWISSGTTIYNTIPSIIDLKGFFQVAGRIDFQFCIRWRDFYRGASDILIGCVFFSKEKNPFPLFS